MNIPKFLLPLGDKKGFVVLVIVVVVVTMTSTKIDKNRSL